MIGFNDIAERVVDLLVLHNTNDHKFERQRNISVLDWSILSGSSPISCVIFPSGFTRSEVGVARRVSQNSSLELHIYQLMGNNMRETLQKMLDAINHINYSLDQYPTLALPLGLTPEQLDEFQTKDSGLRVTNSFISSGTSTQTWEGENRVRFGRTLTMNVVTTYQARVALHG